MAKRPIEQEADVESVVERYRWPLLVAVIVLGLGCLYGLSGVFSNGPTEASGAKVACKKKIDGRLDSVSSWPSITTTAIGSDKVEVSGEVEAQNAEGDPVVHSFECDVQETEGGDWNVLTVHTEVN